MTKPVWRWAAFNLSAPVLPDSQCLGQIHIKDAEHIESFSVQRPPFTPLFWDALFEVLRQTPALLIWPGGMDPEPICCVGNAAVLSELPDDLNNDLNKDWIAPAVVTGGAGIEDCIAKNA